MEGREFICKQINAKCDTKGFIMISCLVLSFSVVIVPVYKFSFEGTER